MQAQGRVQQKGSSSFSLLLNSIVHDGKTQTKETRDTRLSQVRRIQKRGVGKGIISFQNTKLLNLRNFILRFSIDPLTLFTWSQKDFFFLYMNC